MYPQNDPRAQIVGAPQPPVQLPNLNPFPQRPQPQPGQQGLLGPEGEGEQGLLARRPSRLGAILAGTGHGLAQVFGGFDDPGLSGEQNARARKQALLQAGLATMMASGQGQGLPASLATGAMQGQQVSGQAQAMAGRQNTMQQLQQVFGNGTPDKDQLQQLMVQLLLQGDSEGAKAISEVLKSIGGDAAKLMPVNVGDKIILVDPFTGEPRREYDLAEGSAELERVDLGDRVIWHPKGRPDQVLMSLPKGTSPDARAQVTFQRESELANQWYTQNRDSFEIAEAYQRLRSGATQTNVPGDLAILYNYMRMINPNMRLNENQVATVETAGGVPDRIRTLYNHTLRGSERLPEGTRREILSSAEALAQGQNESLRRGATHFTGRARQVGIDPSRVVRNPFDGLIGSPGPTRERAPVQDALSPFLGGS
jgi:hypothetical protein